MLQLFHILFYSFDWNKRAVRHLGFIIFMRICMLRHKSEHPTFNYLEAVIRTNKNSFYLLVDITR